MVPYLGEIRLFAGSHPEGWLECDGSEVSQRDYEALFNLIGTQFGGDDAKGVFNLPDLRGRIPMGWGWNEEMERAKRTRRMYGDEGGSKDVTLEEKHVPKHRHVVMAASNPATTVAFPGPTVVLAKSQTYNVYDDVPSAPPKYLDDATIGVHSGQKASHPNTMPYQALKFCIATYGVGPR